MKRKAIQLLFLVLGICYQLKAQLPNEVITDKISLNSTDSGIFGFSIVNTNYMRNTEYFSRIEEGRTLFGYQLQPKFTYQPAPNVKIEAGTWIRHDFGGNNPFTEVLPTFSVKAKKNYMEMIFGTLEGALSHGILEPMFDINSVINNRIENGFQFKVETNKRFLDIWINWENFIQPNEFNKERFTAGFHSKQIWKIAEKSNLTPYFQLMASHQGGQIDADTISPFMMQFNAAVGLKISKQINGNKSVYLDIAYLHYQETSDSKIYPQKTGNGLMANAGLRQGATDFIFSYWNGTDFIAPRGTNFYQSRGNVDASYYEKNRQLLFFRIIHNKTLFKSPIIASARFEPVYDLNNEIFDYSYSLYLVYRGDFKFNKKH
jgi:hypothetical protein